MLAGAAAGCAVVGSVDPSHAAFPGCPFRALTGFDCPGCGATRGVHQLLRGHPLTALDHNVALAVVVPLALWGWLAWAGAPLPRPRPLRGRTTAVVLGLAVAFALVRNLPLPGARWLASGA